MLIFQCVADECAVSRRADDVDDSAELLVLLGEAERNCGRLVHAFHREPELGRRRRRLEPHPVVSVGDETASIVPSVPDGCDEARLARECAEGDIRAVTDTQRPGLIACKASRYQGRIIQTIAIR